MEQAIVDTYFAPAERAPKQEVINQFDQICSSPFLIPALEAMPHVVFVLNQHRQIVFANDVFYDTCNVDDVNSVLGLRPGEAINCNHSDETPDGCGTTKSCRTCGFVIAILNSLKGKTDNRECRIIKKESSQALDLNIKATPLNIDGELFAIVSAVDISHEKRRRILERVFFHDVMNIITGLKGVSELLLERIPRRLKKLKSLANSISHGVLDLSENVYMQKNLSDAEKNELIVKPTKINSQKLLEEIKGLYDFHPITNNRSIEIAESTEDINFQSDINLLRRCLGNLTKNALEASGKNDIVVIGCGLEEDSISFWIHNPGVIPEHIQHQIFQRSFSTKGEGRGLGTYSIKLFIEKYLNGKASFISTMEKETTFSLSLPLSIEMLNENAVAKSS